MATPGTRATGATGRLIGYARVSTEEQGTDPQLDELRAAGCIAILEEHASGADRARPVLARLVGAGAQLERALITERPRAGFFAARSCHVGSNPGLQAGSPGRGQQGARRSHRRSPERRARPVRWLVAHGAADAAGAILRDVVRLLNRDNARSWTVELQRHSN